MFIMCPRTILGTENTAMKLAKKKIPVLMGLLINKHIRHHQVELPHFIDKQTESPKVT